MVAVPDSTLRTVYRVDDVERARENLRRHDWAKRLVDQLRREVAATVDGGGRYIVDRVPETTPTSTFFINCPRCEGNAANGDYHWDPAEPDSVRCSTCGARYPDPQYPEDAVFRPQRSGAGQVIAYHSAYGYPYYGYVLHSSWSGYIRARKVAHMTAQLKSLATLHAVTGEASYGDAAAAVLVRFAQVYPGYLVHSVYGEWTDLLPRVAAGRLGALPEDEWTVAPNKPDRVLHDGYWAAGRATSGGLEGRFIQEAAIAYDLVRGRLDEPRRRLVENDLLREGTYLLCADTALNNKSISNAAAAGMVGLVLDDPGLVQFGSRVFWHFVRRWFLPDGGTPESPTYGLMALNGMIDFGDALHGRALPGGSELDVYGDPAVARIYRNLYDTLLPDLRYPATADTYITATIGAKYVDLLAQRYDRPEYRALLAEMSHADADPDHDPARAHDDAVYALFHRDPDLSGDSPAPAINLPDVLLPWHRITYARDGSTGRDSTVILSASHWGGHHHRDSLNLTYFDRGHQALSDLGYLWDRIDRDMTRRTAVHNLVVVDESEQRRDGRGGTVELFDRAGPITAVECSSTPYAQTSLYRRTCVLIDHGEGRRYLVDVFAVRGGGTHDYLYHGPTPGVALNGIAVSPSGSAPYGIADPRRGLAASSWRAVFALDDDTSFTAWAPAADEEVLVGDGWGERGLGHLRGEPNRVVPYVVRRRHSPAGELASAFVSVFEVHGAAPIVSGVRARSVGRGGAVVEVDTADGLDVVLVRPGSEPESTGAGPVRTDARLTVLTQGVLYLADGTAAEVPGLALNLPAARSGGLARASMTGDAESWLLVDRAQLRVEPGLPGTVLVDDGVEALCFPLLDVRHSGDETRLVTFADGVGSALPRGEGLHWTILHSGLVTAR